MTAPESAQSRDFLASRYLALVAKLTAVEALCDEAERGEGIAPHAVDARLLRAVLDGGAPVIVRGSGE